MGYRASFRRVQSIIVLVDEQKLNSDGREGIKTRLSFRYFFRPRWKVCLAKFGYLCKQNFPGRRSPLSMVRSFPSTNCYCLTNRSSLINIHSLCHSPSSNCRCSILIKLCQPTRSATKKSSRNNILWARKGRKEEEVVKGKGQRQGPALCRP